MTLGERLRKAREEAGLTRREVSDRLGVTEETIRAWETDEDSPGPRVAQAPAICELFRVSPRWLVLGESRA